MPNIADIIEVAEELEDKAVVPASKRCVAVRNRNASCRKCIDACPADAISAQQRAQRESQGLRGVRRLHDGMPYRGPDLRAPRRRGA